MITDRESEALARRANGWTLQDLAEKWGCSRQRVAEIERRALSKVEKLRCAV